MKSLLAVAALAFVAVALLPAAEACSSITPIMDLSFPEKPTCNARDEENRVCIPLPAIGQSVTFNGELVWSWDTRGCGIEQLGLLADQPVAFRGAGQNPTWLTLSTDPASLVITLADQTNPSNLMVNPDGSVREEVHKAISVTLTRTADPDESGMEVLRSRDGFQLLTLLAEADASGTYVRTFGSEAFTIDARSLLEPVAAPSKDSPAAGAVLLLGLVALTALLRRT